MKYEKSVPAVFGIMFMVLFMAAGPAYAAKTFSVTTAVNGNPAVKMFSKDFQAQFNTEWMLKAGDHWTARQGDSWEEYIGSVTDPDVPESLPDLPEAVTGNNNPVCEAEGDGQCFYISAENGDDDNPGTYAKPWKTYLNIVYYYYERLPENHVISKQGGLQPGDVVYFMSGEYSDTYVMGVEDGTDLKQGFYMLGIHGSSEAPVTFAAYPGQNPVFSAKLPDSQQMSGMQFSNSSNILIDGLEIKATFGHGLSLTDSSSVEVRNCRIHDVSGTLDADHSGILVSGGSSITIHHNLIHDNYGREGDETGGNSSNILIAKGIGRGGDVLVHHNILFYTSLTGPEEENTSGFGILFSRSSDIYSFPDAKFEADHNLIWNCSSASVFSATFNSEIHHNLILDSAPPTIGSLDGLVYHSGNVIENNTIAGGHGLIYNPSVKYGPLGSMTFRKNIVVDTENAYGDLSGIIQICSLCSDTLYDTAMTEDLMAFGDNIYCNSAVELETAAAWLLFNDNSAQSRLKGAAHNFEEWNDLGFDTSSAVYYGYTTPEEVLYPFDGNARDTGGGENHGVVNGAKLTNDKYANADKAYDFNGTSSYIATPLNINPSEMPTLTMSAWVWPRQAGGDVNEDRRQVFSHDDGGFDRSLLMEDSKWHVFTGGTNWNTGATAELNTWQHVAVVFEQNNVRFYKNGQRYSFGSAPGTGTSVSKLMIGDNPVSTWNEFFDGVIDDVRIFSRALSQSEVQEIYTGTPATYIAVDENLKMEDLCVRYEDTSYKFDLVFEANPGNALPEGIYWKMDMDSLEISEDNPGNCIDTDAELNLALSVEYLDKYYSFTMTYEPNPDDPAGLYWKMDVDTFSEIRYYIPVTDDLSLRPVVEQNGNRYAFKLDFYQNPDDPAGLYWKMDEATYNQVNHVTENFIPVGASMDLDMYVNYKDEIRLFFTLRFQPALSGKYWILDPDTLKEF
ncbi:MAG: LamG-like jellyroll fold domain-containing protein [Desulfococcaceae bacterium]